jgi:hypothetical protein
MLAFKKLQLEPEESALKTSCMLGEVPHRMHYAPSEPLGLCLLAFP